jgi:hypothetical protein
MLRPTELRRFLPDRQPTWGEVGLVVILFIDASVTLVVGSNPSWPAVAGGFGGSLVALGWSARSDAGGWVRRRFPDVGLVGRAVVVVLAAAIVLAVVWVAPVPRGWLEDPLVGCQYAVVVYLVAFVALTDGWLVGSIRTRSG